MRRASWRWQLWLAGAGARVPARVQASWTPSSTMDHKGCRTSSPCSEGVAEAHGHVLMANQGQEQDCRCPAFLSGLHSFYPIHMAAQQSWSRATVPLQIQSNLTPTPDMPWSHPFGQKQQWL